MNAYKVIELIWSLELSGQLCAIQSLEFSPPPTMKTELKIILLVIHM